MQAHRRGAGTAPLVVGPAEHGGRGRWPPSRTTTTGTWPSRPRRPAPRPGPRGPARPTRAPSGRCATRYAAHSATASAGHRPDRLERAPEAPASAGLHHGQAERPPDEDRLPGERARRRAQRLGTAPTPVAGAAGCTTDAGRHRVTRGASPVDQRRGARARAPPPPGSAAGAIRSPRATLDARSRPAPAQRPRRRRRRRPVAQPSGPGPTSARTAQRAHTSSDRVPARRRPQVRRMRSGPGQRAAGRRHQELVGDRVDVQLTGPRVVGGHHERAAPGCAAPRPGRRSGGRRGARAGGTPSLTSTRATDASSLRRPADGQVDPWPRARRAAGQRAPAAASWVRGSQDGSSGRPPAAQPVGLALDLGPELVALGGRQPLDPGQQRRADGRRPPGRPARRPWGRRWTPTVTS